MVSTFRTPFMAEKSSFLFKGYEVSKYLQKSSVWNWHNGGFNFAGKLVWQGNLFGQETHFEVNSIKSFIFILAVKHISCNNKVGEI